MKIPEREKPQKKVINKGFLRDLEGYEQSDKNLFHLPRQHTSLTLRGRRNTGFSGFEPTVLHSFYTV